MGISRLPVSIAEKRFIDEHLNEILGASGSGVCIIDQFENIQFVNDKFCSLFGLSESLLLQNKLSRILYDQLVMKSLKMKSGYEGSVNLGGRAFKVITQTITKANAFLGLKIIYDEKISEIEYKQTVGQLENPFPNIIGSNERLVNELIIAKKVAPKDVTVLLRGESGTGKELIAKEIHENSSRSKGPFIAINCAAIPENLIESELMGFEAGSFTGANKRKLGQFELANGGTLFLDEIGDLPYHLQVKLLRVLQERVIRRVGGTQNIPIDVRIITATHQNMEEMIANKLFREDLYYRLNVISIELIPLRERMDDLESLVTYFMTLLGQMHGMDDLSLSIEALEAMMQYEWKGNIRELRNVLERAVVLVDGPTITLNDLPSHITHNYLLYNYQSGSSLINLKGDGDLATLEEYEKEIIELAMNKFGSFNSAGKALGITHKTVAAKYRKYKENL